MPQATDLTIKNAAAADKVFTLYAPAAGDSSLATWKLKEGTIGTVFPVITALAKSSGGTDRNVSFKLRVPSSYSDAVTGLTNVGSAYEMNVTVSVPGNYPEAKKDDAVAFSANFMNLAFTKAMMRDALSAT